jgi:hypothetical protein
MSIKPESEETTKAPRCHKCGQTDVGQYGEYPCPICGLPLTWDVPKNGHDYPACAVFRGGKCTCDAQDDAEETESSCPIHGDLGGGNFCPRC